MTNRILKTTTALVLVAGMAQAQTMVPENETTDVDGAETSIGAEASDAGSEILDTAQAAGDAAGDALENAGEAAQGIAEEGYSAGSDAAARLDAALTADAVVSSNQGETLGTVSGVDEASGGVLVDLDSELETSLDAPVETIVFPPQAFTATDEGVMLDMTGEQLAAAVNNQIRQQQQQMAN